MSRFLKHLSEGQPLLEKGLDLKELKAVVDFFPRTPLKFKQKPGGDLKRLHKFIRGRIRRGIPSIVAYSGPGYRHFAIAVGADGDSVYLMDPAENYSDGMIYNERLRLYPHRGRLHAKDSAGIRVEVGPCIAFWPKGWKLKRRGEFPATSKGNVVR